MLEIENLWVAYGAAAVVRGVSFTVARGEVVALLGPNGAGRSSLLSAIAGAVPCADGRITLGGHSLEQLPQSSRAAAGVGHCPERNGVYSCLTVQENLLLGGQRLGSADRAAREAEMYELFPRLADRRGQVAGTLSGGERQMLMVSRALMGRPRLLLLDEPVQGLAPQIAALVYGALGRMIVDDQLAVVLVEPVADRAMLLARRWYLMQAGAIVRRGDGAKWRASAT